MLTCLSRLEEASDPDSLSQETIIDNLSAEEAHRLSKVRNIGIAVSFNPWQFWHTRPNFGRHTLTLEKLRPRKEYSSIPVVSSLFTKYGARTPSAQKWIRWNWNEKRALPFSPQPRSAIGLRKRTARRRNTTST